MRGPAKVRRISRPLTLIAAVALFVAASAAHAQAWKKGYAVRCYPDGAGTAPVGYLTNEYSFFTCIVINGPGGLTFSSGYVPDGYTFYVTDINILNASTGATGNQEVILYDSYGISSRQYGTYLVIPDGQVEAHFHYETPYLTLAGPSNRLQGIRASSSSTNVKVEISGILSQ